MRMKMVKRYWCDHCNKGGLQSRAMANHELRCTLNPERKCRVCNLWLGGQDKTPAELMALLPVPVKPDWNYRPSQGEAQPEFYAYMEAARAAMPVLREAAHGCPACILAALRQRGIDVPMVEFDFTGEMRQVFAEVNAERHESGGW